MTKKKTKAELEEENKELKLAIDQKNIDIRIANSKVEEFDKEIRMLQAQRDNLRLESITKLEGTKVLIHMINSSGTHFWKAAFCEHALEVINTLRDELKRNNYTTNELDELPF